MEQKKKATFELLSSVNVNDKVEKKSNLTYLSWAWAWAEVKKACPDASYQVKGDPTTQKPYFYDENLGYMVMTEVTIEGETLEMWLPVMDGANKAMMTKPYTYKGNAWINGKKTEVEKVVEAATMFDINKTLMRCLVKNLAMFGLGLYIYAGEDLPETDATPTQAPTKAQAQEQKAQAQQPAPAPELAELKKGTDNWDKVVKYVTANKSLGIEAIGKQLNRKYKMTPAIKKEIANLISAE
jgi:hypothetical protein